MAIHVNQYRPRGLTDDTWERIGPIIRGVVSEAAPRTLYHTKSLLWVFCGYVQWADSIGLPLEREVLLDRRLIERFVLTALKGKAKGTRANQRSILYRILEALTSAEVSHFTPLSESDPEVPYTDPELAALESLMRGQRTAEKRHSGLVIVAFGAGAGLATGDYSDLRGTDVTREGPSTVVRVRDRRAREITVFSDWADLVWELAQESGDRWVFRPGRQGFSPNALNGFARKLDGVSDAVPSSRRLRITWICRHLALGTPANILTEAAGVDTFHALSRYLRFLPEPTVEVKRAWLRGERP
jgi:hypothetical protein